MARELPPEGRNGLVALRKMVVDLLLVGIIRQLPTILRHLLLAWLDDWDHALSVASLGSNCPVVCIDS